MDLQILTLTPQHWSAVKKIFEAGIASGNATFEKKSPEWREWDESHRQDCRFVAIVNEAVAGWIALSNVSERCVYSGVCELSVYIDPAFQRMGVGKRLLDHLIVESEKNNIWTLQAGIFPENAASVRLHEQAGFRKVGIREKIGKMGARWRDVLLLERRSLTIE